MNYGKFLWIPVDKFPTPCEPAHALSYLNLSGSLLMHVPLHQLLPAPTCETTLPEAYSGPLGTHPDRPWVGLCMVASLDGSTVVNGASAGLSSPNDSGVLLALRSVADVILVGAGTARGEGYGPPSKAGQRIGIVTRSGVIDPDSTLFSSGAGFIVTTENAQLDPAARDIETLRVGDDTVDLALAITKIATIVPGTQFIQVEGGSRLNGALSSADLFDEMNLTISPGTVGGAGPRLTTGAIDHTHRFELAQLLVDDESFVFSRWRRRRTPSSP
ncbi:MAG: riboflavin biosynthesis pyrimidine reductase [Candidatus Aldehydirespiratoraceae bacterium]